MQDRSAYRITALLVLVAFSFMISCTATQTPPLLTKLPQEKVQGIKVGDTVKVTTYSGQMYKFKVVNITPTEIEGDGTVIPLAEIDRIEKVYITGKTVAIVVAVMAVIAALLLFAPKSDLKSDRRYTTPDG